MEGRRAGNPSRTNVTMYIDHPIISPLIERADSRCLLEYVAGCNAEKSFQIGWGVIAEELGELGCNGCRYSSAVFTRDVGGHAAGSYFCPCAC